MSRLTATPFNKPSPFDTIRAGHPLSPPDTEVEYVEHGRRPAPAYHEGSALNNGLGYAATDRVEPLLHQNVETANTRMKRVSSLTYLNSSARGQSLAPPRPATKWLVVVVPCSSVSREYESSGQNLSSVPTGRFSDGVLMPLFPTMYGQLTAIAREFSFPSTTGLCLFLQVPDSAFAMNPRVSDESWPILWNHFFDDRVNSGMVQPGLPIAGRVEFDIDMRKARWYDSWISNSKREVEAGYSVAPSLAASMGHGRGDSRTTFAQDQEDDGEPIQQPIPRLQHRHVPRKLSLLDKFDTASVPSLPRGTTRRNVSPPTKHDDDDTPKTLSPVAQEDEPPTAKKDLTKLVNSWRATSTVAPSPIAATGQTSLDPINMPNTVPLSDVEENSGDAVVFNLDDFTWSISSAGPLSCDISSPMSWDRVSSVHIGRRAEGSVCLTPTTCTSAGPADYDPFSPIPSAYRLPSPDLAQRCFDDSPPTPLTATSWGPPLEWPDSPASYGYAPSVDIGYRNMLSRPATPSTATSWGAPLEWPASRQPRPYIHTPDAGQRSFDESIPLRARSEPWTHVWPYHCRLQRANDDDSQPWSHVWPYQGRPQGATDDVSQPWPHVWPYQGRAQGVTDDGSRPWVHVWPYQSQRQVAQERIYDAARPWEHVWPYQSSSRVEEEYKCLAVRLHTTYPCIDIYPSAYPHFNIYPPTISEPSVLQDVKLVSRYPVQSIYPAVYPSFEIYPGNVIAPQKTSTQLENLRSAMKYPLFNIYPAIYPFFEIYSGNVTAPQTSIGLSETAKLAVKYPVLDIYPTVYPFFEIYSGNVMAPQASNGRSQTIALAVKYPLLDIYPAVYPHFEIYPGNVVAPERTESDLGSTRSPAKYPFIEIYPAVYPFFDLYPSIHTTLPVKEQQTVPLSVVLKYTCVYPVFDIYPAVYPHSLSNIYPSLSPPVNRPVACNRIAVSGSTSKTSSSVLYPHFNIYPEVHRRGGGSPSQVVSESRVPAVYPHFNIHPEKLDKAATSGQAAAPPLRLSSQYPTFNLYPAVYPHFEIYPAVPERSVDVTDKLNGIVVTVPIKYPYFNLYPAVYPHFNMYQSLPSLSVNEPCADAGIPPPLYPAFDLYPPVYPHFDIYHSGTASTAPLSIASGPADIRARSQKSAYPALVIYPSVYPYFDIYHSGCATAAAQLNVVVVAPVKPVYPKIAIYDPVYPYFDIYGSGCSSDYSSMEGILPIKLQPQYPTFDLYPAMYPHFDIYPRTAGVTVDSRRGRARKSHDDLHNEVYGSNSTHLKEFEHRRKPRRNHRELHDLVFPMGVLASFTTAVQIPKLAPQTPPSRHRSGSVSTRSSRMLPSPANLSQNPLPRVEEQKGMSETSDHIGMRRSPSVLHSRSKITLHPVEEGKVDSRPHPEHLKSALRHSQSAIVAPSLQHMTPSSLERSASVDHHPHHPRPARRRDSIVLEKARFWGGTVEPTKLTMGDLSEFPMPPRPPIPPIPINASNYMPKPAKLDRSKFPFS
ncbi:hypothetical protein BD410DRAFT_758810 [Rickenella mellea]|uniref:Uncharacterized protein n=1 Tax=Rickenella mellea TaxID=50990 RepID=A0A4R5XG29_9AGAM|nr:hypothetical protein BD410DRAFT_758810 [Rickenella mellea]